MQKISDDETKLRYAKHQDWISGYAQLWDGWRFSVKDVDAAGYQFSGMNLREMDGAYSVMSGCCFSDCDLMFASFKGGILPHAEFKNCDMSHADMACIRGYGSIFSGCRMHGTNLEMAKLSQAYFYDCVLKDADLSHAELYGASLCYSDCRGCDFTGTVFDFSRKDLPDFCYLVSSGENVLIKKGDPDVYELPQRLKTADCMELNRAFHINREQMQAMCDGFHARWANLGYNRESRGR